MRTMNKKGEKEITIKNCFFFIKNLKLKKKNKQQQKCKLFVFCLLKTKKNSKKNKKKTKNPPSFDRNLPKSKLQKQ